MAIGRLDEKSEGLLLLSTNGMVSAEVRSKSVEKEYFVQVDGLISHQAIEELQMGVEITLNKKTYTTLPCDAKKMAYDGRFDHEDAQIRDPRHGPKSWISITLTEGKYRQVRKMTAAVGYPTLRLIRVRIGEIKLGELEPGQVRELISIL
jgi:23S rRNA pseudouridine2457 synthase